MKKILIIIIAALCLASTMQAAILSTKPTIKRNGTKIDVVMTINVAHLNVKSTTALLLTPALVNGTDTLRLPAFGLYGRLRWMQYLRRGQWISGAEESALRKWSEALPYNATVDYQDWMDGSRLVLLQQVYGCSYCQLDQTTLDLAGYCEPVGLPHTMAYLRPEGSGAKTRFVEGSAWVQFPVDETVIYPERFNNPVELAKIRASIDSVRNDKDITINKVALKGFASPESPYKHNTDLASGRVDAVMRYVQNLYQFPQGVVTTDSEPEDWAGLRSKVENSNLEHRQQILDMIDADMDPDKKENWIKKTYPQEYRFMLSTWYPALRHTDYRIEYTIRKYTTPQEAREVAKKNPRNLSLEEFYLATNGLDQESDEFVEIWKTAVRMYPNDPIANLNAAYAALQSGHTDEAERYLQKAGNHPEATYAQALLLIARGDHKGALPGVTKAATLKVAGAKELQQKLENYLQSIE